MYWRYFRFIITWTAPTLLPSTLLPLVVWKEENPRSSFICFSSSVRAWAGASSCFPEGPARYTGEDLRCGRGDLDLERDLERLLLSRLSRSLSRSLSRRPCSLSREWDLWRWKRSRSPRSLSLSLSRPIVKIWKEKAKRFQPGTATWWTFWVCDSLLRHWHCSPAASWQRVLSRGLPHCYTTQNSTKPL